MSNVLKYINVNAKEKKIIQNDYKVPIISSGIPEEITDNNQNEQVVAVLKEAENEAKEIIRRAKEHASELLEKEKTELEQWWTEKRNEDARIQEEAKQQGFEEGIQQGHLVAENQLREEYAEILQKAKQILEDAYQMKEQIIQGSENVILDLSIAIAKKIIHTEIDTDTDIVKEMIKVVLNNVKESEKISLLVNPEYFSYVQVAKDEFIAELNGQAELLIFPDPSVSSGGCIVKTSSGTIDAKIDTQLEEIKRALLGVAGGRVE